MALESIKSATHADTDLEALFAAQVAELKALEERSKRTQSEIDRIRLETVQLKREGQALESETRAVLARVKELVS